MSSAGSSGRLTTSAIRQRLASYFSERLMRTSDNFCNPTKASFSLFRQTDEGVRQLLPSDKGWLPTLPADREDPLVIALLKILHQSRDENASWFFLKMNRSQCETFRFTFLINIVIDFFTMDCALITTDRNSDSR